MAVACRLGPTALVSVVVVVLSVVACSSDDEGAAAVDEPGLADTFAGVFACEGEPGDQIDVGTGEVVGTVAAGTDLLSARAERTEDDLVVEFETLGEVDSAPEPKFQVAKGLLENPGTWFELRALRRDDGTWVLEHRSLPTQLPPEGFAPERIDQLPHPVEVSGTTVRFAVPLDRLPPIDTSPTWQFGSRAGGEQPVIDDCSELEG